MPYVNDVGTVFEATIMDAGAVVNIAAATTLQLWFRRPDGRVLKKTAVLSTNGTDGKMRYTTVANDLTQAGNWNWQPYVVLGTTTVHGNIQAFMVNGNLA